MKHTALKVLLAAAVLIPIAVYAQPKAGNPTTSTVITKAEIDKISATEQSQTTRDENARVVDIGDGWSMELGVIHRGKQKVMTVGEAKAAAAARGNAPAAASEEVGRWFTAALSCSAAASGARAEALSCAVEVLSGAVLTKGQNAAHAGGPPIRALVSGFDTLAGATLSPPRARGAVDAHVLAFGGAPHHHRAFALRGVRSGVAARAAHARRVASVGRQLAPQPEMAAFDERQQRALAHLSGRATTDEVSTG